MNYLQHAEKYLGQITQGWKDEKSVPGLQIVAFADVPEPGTNTFLSLGLSNHLLKLKDSRQIRQELMISMDVSSSPEIHVSLLFSLCEAILARHQGLLRGEVIPLAKQLATKLGLDSVYCAIPVLLDPKFATYQDEATTIVTVWIIPIYASEAAFVSAHGWEAFEDLMEEKVPDLHSPTRAPLI